MSSISRANLPGSGAPMVTFNSQTFWTRDDVIIPLAQALNEQRSSMYGRVTKTRMGRIIELNIPLFGLASGLSVLFPSTFLNPTIGQRIYSTTDLPMVFIARNGDRLTVHNVRLTGLANLKLAANSPFFSGMAKFTGLIVNTGVPTDAAAYFTYALAQTYTETTFATTNLKAKAWTGVWGARTGFTTIQTQDGWTVDWEVAMTPDLVDGVGAVDMFMDTFWARASCIPVGPTWAQIETNLVFQGSGADIGSDVATTDNLVIGDGTSSVTLNNAFMAESGLTFAPSKKRHGNTVWECTRGFSTGVAQAMAAVA